MKERSKYILFAGTLIPRKGFVDLINAFSQVIKTSPDWKLVIAGNGDIEKGKQLSKQLNIEEYVEFPGWICGKQKDEFFSKASVFCLPTYAEGFPIAVLDAMAYGIPVVTTPVGGILDALTENKDVLIFEPGNVVELGKKLKMLIVDISLREELSHNATKIFKEKFEINMISKKMDEIYHSLV